MNEDALHALALRHIQQANQMGVVTVNAAIGKQTDQMQGRTRFFGVVHRVQQGVVLKEIPIPDGFGDAGQFLIHHPAGTDVGVTDLAVAHLPVGQSDVHSRRPDGGAGIFLKQPGEVGGFGRLNGVAVGIGIDPETVHNNENQRFFHKKSSLSRCRPPRAERAQDEWRRISVCRPIAYRPDWRMAWFGARYGRDP